MRSLFTTILLWFMLTTVLSFSGSWYIFNTFQRPAQQQYNGRIYELREARKAWESGGRASLEAWLAEFNSASNGEAVLADGSGKDVLTGRDWSNEIRSSNPGRGRGGPMFPFVRFEGVRRAFNVAPTLSRDGKYYFLAIFPSREPARSGWGV